MAKTSSDIEARYREFHRKNPHVYKLLCRLARQWMAKHGKGKLGIAMLFEHARWESAMSTEDSSGFKLNNNYRSRYSRDIMENESDLAGVFATRELHSLRMAPEPVGLSNVVNRTSGEPIHPDGSPCTAEHSPA